MERTKRSRSMSFLWTFLAVVAGIWIWSKWQTAKKTGGTLTLGPLKIIPAATDPSVSGGYEGPDVDPQTGAYVDSSARSGTVGYTTQGVP